jgi:hypothetical protein
MVEIKALSLCGSCMLPFRARGRFRRVMGYKEIKEGSSALINASSLHGVSKVLALKCQIS